LTIITQCITSACKYLIRIALASSTQLNKPIMKPLKNTLKTSLALLGLGLLTAGQTQAAIVTWSGASGANWSTNSSWTGSVPPADNTTTDTAQFTVDTSGTVNLSAVRSVAALDIQRDTTFSGQALTLSSTAGVTNLTLAAGMTAVFNNTVYSTGGNRTLGSGSTLTFNGQSPFGGTYNMTAATVNTGGLVYMYNSPLFTGTGMVNYTSTALAQGPLRFGMDGVNFTFKSASADPTSANGSALQFAGTTALNLERNVDFTAGYGLATVSSSAQVLAVGFANSANNKASTLTISGGYQAQFNQLLFGVYNGNTISLDGSTLLISGNQKQGVFLTDVNGGQYNAYGLNTYTITSTANGGTMRVGANATSSFNKDTSATSNYGATLLVSGNATLINNGSWTNKNYTTNTTYTGLQVNSTATLGGNGSFDLGATVAGTLSAKNAIISGSVAPGDGGIGALSVTALSLTWNGGADWKFELGSSSQADLLSITGDFAKGTGSAFRFDFLNSASQVGTYKLVAWSGNTTFAYTDFSYTNYTLAGKTASFEITGSQLDFVVVPEPSTWAMLLSGLGILACLRRSRRA
jgi:hypothetical protein